MNLSPRWLSVFANVGIEAVHWSSVGAPNASDAEIMSYARTRDYIVLTHDLDFAAILAATHGDKPSVVQIRATNISPEAIGKQLIAALQQMATDLAEGALLTVDADRARLRVLPLHQNN